MESAKVALKAAAKVLKVIIKQLVRFLIFLSISIAILYIYLGPKGRDHYKQEFRSQIRKPFGPTGSTYFPLWDRYWQSNVPFEITEQIGIMNGDRVLELGCGTGTILTEAASRAEAAQLTCVEHSPEMVRYARNHNLNHVKTGKIKVMQGQAHMLPFAARSFDIVYSYNLVNMYPDNVVDTMLAEQWRVLRDGGLLAVCVRPSERLDMMLIKYLVNPFIDRSIEEMQDIVQKPGLGDRAYMRAPEYDCFLRMKNQNGETITVPEE